MVMTDSFVTKEKPRITPGFLFVYTLGSTVLTLGMSLFFVLLFQASMDMLSAVAHESQYLASFFRQACYRSL